jgi:hypothetical protein
MFLSAIVRKTEQSEMDDLTKLSAEALRQLYAETVLLYERTHHVGRANRIYRWISDIAERLIALGGMTERELLPLLSHPSGKVRYTAAFDIKPFNRNLFLSTMGDLVHEGGTIGREAQSGLAFAKSEDTPEPNAATPALPPDPNWERRLNWQEDNQPPRGMTRGQLEDRVVTEFSAVRARQVLALMRPAIGLWPQPKTASKSNLGSRHCGKLWAPPGWQWPLYEEEPMYFLGQINCAELAGLPSAERLPKDGLLAFFGDFDAIAGCDAAGSFEQGSVHYWSAEKLVPTEPPLPLDYPEEQMATPLAFRPFCDLPHPYSKIVEELALSKEEHESYFTLYDALVQTGIPEEVVDHCDLESKLFGWPNLVQNDFDLRQIGPDAFVQLAQLPARLGPGGSLYFFIRESDLAQRRFDRCILEAQNT